VKHLNYAHLHYFWMTAREGGVTRAATTLHVTPQTVSAQVTRLEEAVGTALFERSARSLRLTETGRTVFHYADEIFSLGKELGEVLRGRTPSGELEFRVGVADVVPKLVAYRLLETAIRLPERPRLVCVEGKLDGLLSELAVHRLDLVIADSPMAPHLNVRAYNHALGESTVGVFAVPALARRHRKGFPRSLDGAPVLLPTRNTELRRSLETWLEHEAIAPQVVAEFEDSALLKAFAQAGHGLFPAPMVIETEVRRQYGVELVGRLATVRERFYAVSAERRIKHPAVAAVSRNAKEALFA
jgi:LysR family transcriptional activator of nhaA